MTFFTCQNAIDRLSDVRVEMHRIDNLDVLVRGGDVCQRMADFFKATTEALTPVTGHQNHLFIGVDKRVICRQF